MNPNYRHTVTLYNCMKATDSLDKKDHWYRTVLEGCYYKSAVTRIDSGTNAGVQNTYVVRILEDSRYLPYAAWIHLPDGERSKHFTMSLDDLVLYGRCPEQITGISGQTATQLMKQHKPDAFKVTACSDNTRAPVGKHYRLGG